MSGKNINLRAYKNMKKDLEKTFSHRAWFVGHKLTRKEALDKLAETGDFYLDKKINYKESEKKNLGKGVFDYEPVNDDILCYCGSEKGTYKLTLAEKEYFIKRDNYYKRQRELKAVIKLTSPAEREEKRKRKIESLKYNLQHSESELKTALKKYPESIDFWKDKVIKDKELLLKKGVK